MISLPTSGFLAFAYLFVAVQAQSVKCKAAPLLGLNFGTGLSSAPVPVSRAIQLMQARGANAIKLFSPDKATYAALAGTGITVITASYDPPSKFATDDSAALAWVDSNIVPYVSQIRFAAIAIANEKLDPPYTSDISSIVPAMWALYRALTKRGLQNQIKVVTPQHTGFLQNSYPPSASEVQPALLPAFMDLLKFVDATGSWLFINCYPFFPYKDNPQIGNLFTFFQGFNGYYDKGLYYQNLFDSMFDGLVWAVEKLGYPDIDIAVGETGWPTSGSVVASVTNAKLFNSGLLGKLTNNQGTPKRPGCPLRAFLFEAFDEDRKDVSPGLFEVSWGLSYMNGTDKYPLSFKASYSPLPTKLPPAWCVANSSASAASISGSVGWACSSGGVNCGAIRALCSPALQASAIFNTYFQAQGQVSGSCGFGGAAVMTSRSPASSAEPQCSFPGYPPSPNHSRPPPSPAMAPPIPKLSPTPPLLPTPQRPKLSPSPPSPPMPPPSPVVPLPCPQGVQGSLDWLCRFEPGDCTLIRPGSACFLPDSLYAHASYAFHVYYQRHLEQGEGACNFAGAAKLQSTPLNIWPASCPALTSSNGQWCVAACSPPPSPPPPPSPLSPQCLQSVQGALDWLCGYEPSDCSLFQPGTACSVPSNLFAHASYAFHVYYQRHLDQGAGACVFGGAAKLQNAPLSIWPASCPALTSSNGLWCVAAC